MDDDLRALADAHGVATWYRDGERRRVDVDPEVVVTVLGLLDVAATTRAAVRAGLAAVRAPAAGMPGTVLARVGVATPLAAAGVLRDEAGTERAVTGELPADLAPGYYEFTAGESHVDESSIAAERTTVVVAPRRLAPPPSAWGWMVQLYALHSAGSWGHGDLADLRELVRWSAAEHGAGAVLVNPLHAVTPTYPVQPSPYTPSSRRFVNPLYLRVEDTAAYRRAGREVRADVDAQRVPAGRERIDRDATWRAKSTALDLLWRAEGGPARHLDTGLRDFATFCALAERHGPRWTEWPAALRHPAAPEVARLRAELAERVAFHAWLQQQCAEQLAAVRVAAREAGMAVGVVHDLAVGVDPAGADAWALQDVLAAGVTVGAPPDAFTPAGQDWGLPPWRPDRLAATGYRAYRDMLGAALAHADGLRIDHVAGLWRLWWVPPGAGPEHGTYVHYDADALLGVLTLEARRAGAVVIGEDLGTVEPTVTAALAERNMLGCSVLWFARAAPDGTAVPGPLHPPAQWPARSLATVSTHDLPTAPGFLRGEHVRLRASLGLLGDDRQATAEQQRADTERAELLDLLRAEGLLTGAEPAEDELVVALHALLARTPCTLRLAAPYDLVGEPRQPNLPGTVDEYPNWRLPLPVSLEELRVDPRVAAAMAALAGL